MHLMPLGESARRAVDLYGKGVAIIEDIAQRTAASKSLAAFVTKSNGGYDLWFA
jgi:hypothetical protein